MQRTQRRKAYMLLPGGLVGSFGVVGLAYGRVLWGLAFLGVGMLLLVSGGLYTFRWNR